MPQRRRGGSAKQVQRQLGRIQHQLSLLRCGALQVSCPADPPNYQQRRWNRATVRRNITAVGPLSVADLAGIVIIENGLDASVTAIQDALFNMKIHRVEVYGNASTTATAPSTPFELAVEFYDLRAQQTIGTDPQTSRGALVLRDVGTYANMPRVAAQFADIVVRGNSTAPVINVQGGVPVIAYFHLSWMVQPGNALN